MDKLDTLYRFLDQENTKAFIVLVNGKIAVEKYFGTFTRDSSWYWASAGKTLTAFLVGKAQEEGKLKITDTSSKYLGKGWTKMTPAQEAAINIRHQLTMTSGLDDKVPDNHCTIDTCLIYKAAPATRWAYHNAPYTLLEKVLVDATGTAINTYTSQKLLTKTGMTGLWFTIDYNNVFISRPRSMARFGLLAMNRFVWNGDTLLKDTGYVRQLTNTSQQINKSYGYLWWLNGKSSFMLPSLQTVFPGSLAPSAPSDMYAALGKNGQILSVSPSKGIVFVRMGNPSSGPGAEVSVTLPENIWSRLNAAMCNTAGKHDIHAPVLEVFPVPSSGRFELRCEAGLEAARISDLSGRVVLQTALQGKSATWNTSLAAGVYVLTVKTPAGSYISRRIAID